MNDFGLVQLIWIKRLVSETTRINTLIECNRLSKKDLNRYKSVISAIDDFCAFVINSQNWRDIKNISSIVDEVEMVLFQHFYEQIDAFEDEKVDLDLSNSDEVNLRFENPLLDDMTFSVIDDETYSNIDMIEDIGEEPFNGPILEGNVFEVPEEIVFELDNDESLEKIFNMKDGDSMEISLEDFIKLISQNQDDLSFTLNPEVCGDDYTEGEEVSFEEFVSNLISNNSKTSGFDLIDDEDFF
ncbi:hypothetical protein [Methanobrevibacter sp.]|uniref:hypothetical protein n=1 Tax=Methanobrevibacter sp. TaxID=66852 RepID=UPI00388F66D6